MSDRVSPLSERLGVPNDVLLGGLMLTQAITLVGSYTTGTLARKRRVKLAQVNSKLRTVRDALLCCSCPALCTKRLHLSNPAGTRWHSQHL